MKFLCVSCDEPMKFVKADAPEEGSVSIIFGCPKCNNQIAMLTNPQETQLVKTLGVNIGGGAVPHEPLTLTKGLMTDRKPLSDDDIVWTKEAEERLKRAPSFVQPMAKRAILSYARENGIKEITTQVMDVVKEKSGM